MSISTDLKLFYPKYNHAYFHDQVVIEETETKATVRKLIFKNSNFHFVDTKMIEDCTSLFHMVAPSNPSSHEILKKDCDGIILFQNEADKFFFLVELKSGFSTTELFSAMHQIISSYIKSNMLMHLLATYEFSDYTFKAFIACHPPKDDYKVTLSKQLLMSTTSKYRTEAEFASNLYLKKETTIRPVDCEKLRGLNLNQKCIFPQLIFHYIEVPIGTKSVDIDVMQYV